MSTTYFLALLKPIVVGTDLAIEGLARLVALPVTDAVEAAVFRRRPVADSLRSPDATAAASRTIAPADGNRASVVFLPIHRLLGTIEQNLPH